GPAPGAGPAQPVPAGPVEIHTTVPAGSGSRVLRLADAADDGWTATLDGKPLTPTTVDGWAQGFRLPDTGGRLDVTYDAPIARTAWLWAQGALAVVLVVLALPGRRRDVDDDLPEEQPLPAQATAGEGRRARRLRAQAEEPPAEDRPGTPPPPEQPPAAVPHQPSYEGYDATYAPTGYAGYGTDPYQTATGYDQQPYQQPDPYQTAPYDPYAYNGTADQMPYDPAAYPQQGYDPAYDPARQGYDPAQHPHGTGSQRPDGSQQ
ncbi:family 2 glycosyl transferase, partial [Streptomyces tricolor]